MLYIYIYIEWIQGQLCFFHYYVQDRESIFSLTKRRAYQCLPPFIMEYSPANRAYAVCLYYCPTSSISAIFRPKTMHVATKKYTGYLHYRFITTGVCVVHICCSYTCFFFSYCVALQIVCPSICHRSYIIAANVTCADMICAGQKMMLAQSVDCLFGASNISL
jgi:hypothetical protein